MFADVALARRKGRCLHKAVLMQEMRSCQLQQFLQRLRQALNRRYAQRLDECRKPSMFVVNSGMTDQ
ncbi:hypothetical protein D3C81_2234160 [compost metagenome]